VALRCPRVEDDAELVRAGSGPKRGTLLRGDTGEAAGRPDPAICADGVDNDADGLTDAAGDRGCLSEAWSSEADCRKGTFFVDHAVWPDGTTPGPAYEGALLDLLDHIDTTYRTRPPERLPR
jgi:hypothetical protein